jgi:hypothetical protein
MRSLPKYLVPCYPECSHLGKCLQRFHPAKRGLLISAIVLTLRPRHRAANAFSINPSHVPRALACGNIDHRGLILSHLENEKPLCLG